MRSVLFATLLLSAACSVPAQADQLGPSPAPVVVSPSSPRIALAISPAKIRAPYDVQVIRESGETLPTFAQRDRFYVQGNANERYIILITNPTGNRVEAVVSVDGLDVVDGEAGDLHKRGYVVPPYGETRIEGFRTSHEDVATFRFSSVDNSYAGKKGVARNVGVIAVALFEEQAAPEPQIIVGEESGAGGFRAPYDYEDDVASKDSASPRDRPAPPPPPPVKKKAMAPSESRAGAPAAPAGAVGRARTLDVNADEGDGYEAPATTATAPRTERSGLGTEYGEQRYSAASFTKFVRAADRPIAIAELRYNDTAGLMALGIPVTPLPDEGEIMTRETADPFPGDTRFSRPP